MSVAEILKKMIEDRSYARKMVELAIKQIKARDFVNAMRNNYDPSRLILNHFHPILENQAVKPLVQTLLRAYWNEIESYLTDVRKVYNLLCENPELREVLKKPEAVRYLNFAVAGAYYRLYNWVWRGENPYA